MARMNRKLYDARKPQKRTNLPKATVNILIRWLKENCTNPYLPESTKKILMEVNSLIKMKDKNVDKGLILNILCFNGNSFAHHSEETQWYERDCLYDNFFQKYFIPSISITTCDYWFSHEFENTYTLSKMHFNSKTYE